MDLTGGHIIGLFTIIFGLFTTLVGIIWRQNAAWIKSIEVRATEDRGRFEDHVRTQAGLTTRLFDEMSHNREILLGEMEELKKTVSEDMAGENARFQRCLQMFQTRSECAEISAREHH